MTATLPPPPAVPRVTCSQTLTLTAAPHLKAGTKTTRTCIYPASRQKLIFVLKYASHPSQTPRVLASTLALTGARPSTLSLQVHPAVHFMQLDFMQIDTHKAMLSHLHLVAAL